MRRLPRTHKKLTMGKDEEPDFFELAKTSPLPSLEEAKTALDMRKVQRIQDHFHREAVQPMAHVNQLPVRLDAVGAHEMKHSNQVVQAQMAHANMYFHSGAIPPQSFPPGSFPRGY